VAGAVDAAFLVFSGNGTVAAFLRGFLAPTLLGNAIGGIALVALLNHAPLAATLRTDPAGENAARRADQDLPQDESSG